MSSTISPGCAAARSNNTSATGASNASCACCRFNQRSAPGPFQYSISAALRSSPVGRLIVRNSIRLTVCARSSRFEPVTSAHRTPECPPRGSGTDRRMKFLPLIWSGIWRKPGRTILIFLQVSVAFALFGVLQGLKTGVEHLVAAARAALLIVHSRANFLCSPLPLGLLERIKSVPGVKVVVPVERSGGSYQKPDQQVGIVAVSPEGDWLSAFTFLVTPEAAAALRNTRTGALMPEEAAKKYGWKIGDHIPLVTRTA